MSKITFLTRHYPPNKNINGILVCEMVDFLEKHHQTACSVVYIDGKAPGNNKYVEPKGTLVPLPFSKFITKGLTTFWDNYRMIKKANNIESDWIILTTSPPLLPLFANLFLKKSKKWILWSFDLFPEGFSATGKVSEKNAIYRWWMKKTYAKAPEMLLSLGTQQAKHIQGKYGKKIPTMILPAGVKLDSVASERNEVHQPEWFDESKIILGYFGNIGDAHNPDFLEKAIELSGKMNFQFVLACYGVHEKRIKDFARKFSHVIIAKNGLPGEHLPYIDMHLVTLKDQWTHVAVPSKAVTAISMGRPILFCGNPDSDNWFMFQKSGYLVEENKDLNKQIQKIFNQLNKEDIDRKSEIAKETFLGLKKQVLETYNQIGKL